MANNQTNTARLLCSFFITVCLYTQNIKIKSTLQSTGKAVRQMWVRRFQLGWSLQAHDQWFPVGSCAALRRRRGAFWWGWGGRAKCQGSGRDGTGGSFGLRHKKNRWLEIGHITELSVVAEEDTTIATPVPPSVPAPPEALLKLT